MVLGWMVAFPDDANAVALRYALIIGNNIGVDGEGKQPFPPLYYAEQEAAALKKKLVSLSNFDASPKRTRLLVGATRYQVKAALESLIRQKRQDGALVGKTETLFLFYFTGHGLAGELLLEDGPLTADEVGDMFRELDADFSVGIFDACYSGSLEKEALKSKGVRATPGLNLFREMPEEVLSAQGRIWYVSSGPGQASYEDENIGGVFTHFFIKGLEEAPLDGPGITLDRIWHYARKNTVDYTAARNREQVPEQFIAKLKASAPIYFSFPVERDATLVLSKSVSGRFALSYADGHLTEIVNKPKGKERKLAVYPGQARLLLIETGRNRTLKEFTLKRGEEVVIHHMPEEAPSPAIGRRSVSLWEKGIGLEKPITASTIESGVSTLIGASYDFRACPKGALFPVHGGSLNVHLAYARLSMGLRVGYGHDRHTFGSGSQGTWDYTAHSLTGDGRVGAGFDIKRLRLSVGALLGFAHFWQKYGDGLDRTGWALQPGAFFSVLFPNVGRLVGELLLHGGPVRTLGIAMNEDYLWSFAGGASLIIHFRAM